MYKLLHRLKYGVDIYESVTVTGEVLKVICGFCVKNKVEKPEIFKRPLRRDIYVPKVSRDAS